MQPLDAGGLSRILERQAWLRTVLGRKLVRVRVDWSQPSCCQGSTAAFLRAQMAEAFVAPSCLLQRATLSVVHPFSALFSR